MSSDTQKHKPAPATEAAYTKKWAKFWRVTQRTVQRWVKNPDMPRVDDVVSMVQWAAGPEQKTPDFMKRVNELRNEREKGEFVLPPTKDGAPTPTAETFSDPDWQEFLKAGAPSSDPTKQFETLERFRNYYAFKLNKANQLNDTLAIRSFSDLVIKYEKAIRDNKLAADKLGIEAGELLSRAEHEAIVAAHAFWSMRAVDAALNQLTKNLLNLSSPEQARGVLEPVLLSARFFDPLVHSARTSARNALPVWFIDRYVEVIDDYIENGRKLAQSELHPTMSFAFSEGDGI